MRKKDVSDAASQEYRVEEHGSWIKGDGKEGLRIKSEWRRNDMTHVYSNEARRHPFELGIRTELRTRRRAEVYRNS